MCLNSKCLAPVYRWKKISTFPPPPPISHFYPWKRLCTLSILGWKCKCTNLSKFSNWHNYQFCSMTDCKIHNIFFCDWLTIFEFFLQRPIPKKCKFLLHLIDEISNILPWIDKFHISINPFSAEWRYIIVRCTCEKCQLWYIFVQALAPIIYYITFPTPYKFAVFLRLPSHRH